MEFVRWGAQPQLSTPIVIAAFEGWSDAGQAASLTADFLIREWDLEEVASLDPEEFFEFATVRPIVKLDENNVREIEWPAVKVFAGRESFGGFDVIVVRGREPQLRWRKFSEQLIDVARKFDARLVVTLGALHSEVAHTAAPQVIGTSSNNELLDRYNLMRSRYEGPTGIVGVLTDAMHRAGIPAMSMWSTVPHYLNQQAFPKAALALTKYLAAITGAFINTDELASVARSQNQQIDEWVKSDPKVAEFVMTLDPGEDSLDSDDGGHPAGTGTVPLAETNPDELVAEVEKFLRDQAAE